MDERTIRRSIKRLKDAGYLTVQTTIKEDADRGFIKRNTYYIAPIKTNYFFLDNSFFQKNYPSVKKTNAGIYKELCEFCQSKGVTPPNWDKRAMSVLLTKYNAIGLLRTEPISITYQLNKRCKTLPEKASLPYFIKVLDMQEQYKAVIEQVEQNKLDKEDFKGFAFE